jgi:hypothetical protein
LFSIMKPIAALPAAQTKGLPPKVLPCFPVGACTLSEQIAAPIGSPPAMAFAAQRMSGCKPK